MDYPLKGESESLEPVDQVSSKHTLGMLALVLLILFVIVVVRRAWISDDAYITFRTVDNFISGYRLVWNVGERVQAYTHPLWMFLVSFFYFFTREIYLTVTILSVAIAVLTLFLMARWFAVSELSAVFSILLLALSKAYIDFSTSGLENSLSHLLIVVFFTLLFAQPPGSRSLFWLSLTASLGMVNRMDLALVFLPGLVYAFWLSHSRKALLSLVLGQLPFIIWELFSIFYYGFPFPNTAYAKLNTGVASSEYIQQGLLYLLNSIEWDPTTLAAFSLGMIASIRNKDRRVWLIAAGGLFYLAYVIKVGGDFMSGRFLTVPLLCAALCLVRYDFRRIPQMAYAAACAIFLILAFSVKNPSLHISDYGELDQGPVHIGSNGILDERMIYYGGTGLLNATRSLNLPDFYWAEYGEAARVTQMPVADNYGIGLFGFYAGPNVYVLDKLALADPLLARLPAARKVDWRIGHLERVLPDGYYQTLHLGKNAIRDENLKLYYDKLEIITKGPLFSLQRLVEIWKMNTGQYDYLIDPEPFFYPDLQKIEYSQISSPTKFGLMCGQNGAVSIGDSGLDIEFGKLVDADVLHIWLDGDDEYELVYFHQEAELGRQKLPTAFMPEPGGVSLRELHTPESAQTGFDRLRILPLDGDGVYCIGSLNLVSAGE